MPDITLQMPISLVTDYDLALGTLYNGAIINGETNMVDNIGGTTKGAVELTLIADKTDKYILLMSYLSPKINGNMRIAINGVDLGVNYNVPQTLGNTIKEIKIFNIVVNLKAGKNKIGIYGHKEEVAPSVGKLILKQVLGSKEPASIYSTAPNLTLITSYDAILGSLTNGAIINEKNNFVDNIGGKDNGAVEVVLTVIDEGEYNLALNYISANKDTNLKIDVNGVDLGKVYFMAQTNSNIGEEIATFYIVIKLKSGNNTIKFYGDGINEGPSIGTFSIKPLNTTNNSQNTSVNSTFSTIYDAATGKLYNGASVNEVTNLVDNLGGKDDGSVEVQVKCDTDGQYSLSLNYLSSGIDSNLKIDINGIDSGEVYPISKTSGNTSVEIQVFNITINLKAGYNVLKFHGNKESIAPSIGMFTVIPLYIFNIPTGVFSEVITPTIPVIYETSLGILSNGAIINEINNFVDNIGGKNGGYAEITLKIDNTGEYTLALNYLSYNIDSIMMIDVNGVNSGSVYSMPSTGDKFQVFNVNLNLTVGVNIIKFYGDRGNSNLSIGSFTLNKNDAIIKYPTLKPTITEAFVNKNEFNNKVITLTGSAAVKDSFITGIGGSLGGDVTLNVDIPREGIYDFGISYVALDNSSKIKIDVNGENTGVIYEFDKTNTTNIVDHRTKVVQLNFKSGVNIIKIYS